MSALHRRFMNIAGPTDVITFQHGEIFISVETARRQGASTALRPRKRFELYIVHGLLHLAGFDDKTAASARIMRKTQAQIVRSTRTNVAAVAGERLRQELLTGKMVCYFSLMSWRPGEGTMIAPETNDSAMQAR